MRLYFVIVNSWLDIFSHYPSSRANYYVRVNNGPAIVKFIGLERKGEVLVNHEKKTGQNYA